MWYIISAVALLGIIAGIFGYLDHRNRQKRLERGETLPEEPTRTVDPDCCGEHAVCERDSLLAAAGRNIEYYDDDELDAFAGTPSGSYPEKAVEQFREVLYTLADNEVAGWIRSLQLRHIDLPDELKDEALMIVGERRNG